MNTTDLIEGLDDFWTNKKLGKKSEMKQKHFELLKTYFAGLSIKEFFVELENSKLNIQETKFIKYETMYEKTLAAHYLTTRIFKFSIKCYFSTTGNWSAVNFYLFLYLKI